MRLLLTNISELLPMDYGTKYRRGKEMNELQILSNAFLLINDGKVSSYGLMKDCPTIDGVSIIDCKNKLVTPGLIDSHTHLVFGGSREHELSLKMQGYDYLDILKMGGGIHSTVEATKKASKEELAKKAEKVLHTMNSYGVTAVECKSGYGMDEETELKQLEVVRELNTSTTLVSTFMGAHVIPKGKTSTEHLTSMKEFIMKYKHMFDFVDIFIEDQVFGLAEAKDYLEFAKSEGLKVRVHADEIVPMKGAEMAVDIGASSADHLIATSSEGIKKIGRSNTVASLLPITSFYLDKPFAKAREFINHNAIVTISTDYNPGSAPSENIQFAMNLALLKYKMTPAEIWHAVTINAAYSLGIDKGTLKVGADADFVIWNTDNHQYPMYHQTVNDCEDVFIKGQSIKESKL